MRDKYLIEIVGFVQHLKMYTNIDIINFGTWDLENHKNTTFSMYFSNGPLP